MRSVSNSLSIQKHLEQSEHAKHLEKTEQTVETFELPKSNFTFFLLLSMPMYSFLHLTRNARDYLCFEQLLP